MCIIKDIYRKVKSCVRSCNSYSEYFEYAIGLRQGEVMSPVMFSLFVEDIELHMQSIVDYGIQIDDSMLIMLLFADDMANFAKTPDELQDHLNNRLSYCNSSGLHANTNKTQVMVFKKRCGVKLVVDNFNYLATIFNYTSNFSLNQEYIAGKALKALNILMYNCKKIH